MYFLEQMFQKLKRHNLGNRAREAVPQMPHRRHATANALCLRKEVETPAKKCF